MQMTFFYLLENFCNVVQYADDTVIVLSGENINILIDSVNNVLMRLQRWCICNSLCINKSKTKAMIFSLRKYENLPNVVLDGQVIEFVDNFKYLGINFDSKLTFNHHLNQFCSKLSMLTGITYHIGPYLNERSAINFYYAFIFSVISYGIAVWGGNIHKSDFVSKINSRHRRILRNLFAKHSCYDYNAICKKYSILKVVDVYKYFLAILTFNVNKNNSTLDLRNWLNAEGNQRHEHFTRHRNDLALPFPRINIIKCGYVYNALEFWNSIEESIKNTTFVNSFKRKLKQALLSRYN